MPADGFDPYYKWLGIPPEEQPPTHYRLLGIVEFEADRDVIANAGGRQAFHLRQQADGPQAALARRLLAEVATAKQVLLNPAAKAKYDQGLLPDQSLTPAVDLPALDIEVAPTFRRKPFKSKGFSIIPESLLVRVGSSVIIAGVLLLLLYLSDRKDGRKGEIVATTNLPSPVTGTAEDSEPMPSEASPPAADSPPAASVDDKPGDQPVADTTADSPDMDAKDSSDAAMIQDDAAGDPPSPANAGSADNTAPPDEGAALAESTPETTADIDPSKTPVPDAKDQAQAKSSIRSKRKAEFANAKSADERAALAKTLLTEARNLGDNNPKRFALFALAIDQAAAAGNFTMAADGWNDLAERFQVDALAGRWETLEKSAKTKHIDALQSALRQLFDDATEKDRYDLARKALAMLAKSDPDEANRYESELKSVDALVASYGEAKSAFEQLKSDPDEPTANRKAGEFLCFGKRDWPAGFLLLVRCDDPVLKRLAAGELAHPAKPKAKIRLADSWWEFSDDQADPRIADSAKSRARFWYMEALPELTGDDREKAEKRATLEARVHGASSPGAQITAARFKGKLQGKVSYDAETGELTLSYDFHDASQLKDFDGDAPLTDGQLDVPGGEVLHHLAKFKTLKMTGTVAMKSKAGDVIRGSAGLLASRDGPAVKISSGKESASSNENGPTDDDLTLPFELDTSEKLVTFRLGDLVVGKPMADGQPGQIEFCGGESGAQFSGLVMSGQPDSDWLADLLALPRTETKKNSSNSSGKPKAAPHFDRIHKVVLWNEHNSGQSNSGTRTCNLVLSRNGKSVWQKKDLEVPWEADQPTSLAVDVPQILADSVRVEITATNQENKQSGGLAEVEVFDKAGDNLARDARVIVSAEPGSDDLRKGATLVDGITDSKDEMMGYWLLPVGQLGWADIRLMPREAPPPAAKPSSATAGKEPAKTGGKQRKSLDAKIYACCDDAFKMHVNGVPALDGNEDALSSGGVALAAGDVIAVKATNTGGRLGFCCVIKFSNGQLITTSDGWSAYVPENEGQWSAPKQIKNLDTVVRGNSTWPPSEPVKEGSGVDAAQIWAAGRQDTCYLVFVVGPIDFPKRKPAK